MHLRIHKHYSDIHYSSDYYPAAVTLKSQKF